MEYFLNSALLPTSSPLIRVVCVCLSTCLCSSQAIATEEAYREKILNEIRSLLIDKNKELAEQLVDIRIEEERKLGKKTLFQSVPRQEINLDEKKTDKNEIQFQSTTEFEEENNQDISKVNTKNKWYLGLGLGSSNTGLTKFDLSNYSTATYKNHQNKSTANKIYFGYKYSHENSIEIYYAQLGTSDYSIGTSSVNWYAINKAVSYGLSGKYHPIKLIHTKPFFRYGVQKITSIETGINIYTNYSERNTSSSNRALFGIGVDYSLNERLALTVEIEKYGGTGSTEANVRKPSKVNPKVVYFSANYSF